MRFSVPFALACATPFAALATLAALNMRRDLLSLVALAWFANQVVGYGFLAYPQTWDSFAWGGAIGIAALPAAVPVVAVARLTRFGRAGVTVAAFAAYERWRCMPPRLSCQPAPKRSRFRVFGASSTSM